MTNINYQTLFEKVTWVQEFVKENTPYAIRDFYIHLDVFLKDTGFRKEFNFPSDFKGSDEYNTLYDTLRGMHLNTQQNKNPPSNPNITELSNLIGRIEKETGFWVFVHGGGRSDVSDFGDGENYARAIHNLKDDGYFVVALYDSVLRQAIKGMRSFEPKLRPDPRKDDYDVVLFGALTDEKKVKDDTQNEMTIVKKRGLGKLFGGKKELEKKSFETKTIYGGFRKLSDVIKINSNDNAYFIALTLRTYIADDVGRTHDNFPMLNIIGRQDLIKEIVNYLKHNPQQYITFIEQVLPKNKFPKVHDKLVSNIREQKKMYTQPGKRISFREITIKTDTTGKPIQDAQPSKCINVGPSNMVNIQK